jgi:hypothetical protein
MIFPLTFRATRGIGVVAASLLVSGVLPAQSTISVQGFGYPTSGLSTRSLAAGGATGEIDPLSVSNPAILASFTGAMLYFQADPEYRTLRVGTASERATIARYPIVAASYPLSATWTAGLSASNLLDRSFETTTRGTTKVADSILNVTNSFKSDGAIADVRLGFAWSAQRWLKLGFGAHAITGDNRVRSTQVFDDSTRFSRLSDTATVGYTGSAYSAGFEVQTPGDLSIAGSYRRGGPMSVKRGDTTISNAHVPDHMAMSVAYLGIRGSALAVRTSKDTWSRMAGLGSPTLKISDGWDTGIGADVLGPRFGERTVNLRAGYRWRTLPFGLSSTNVDEKTASVGLGTFAARGRAAFDFALLRSTRSAGASLSENAWTLSFGLTVRP